MLSFILTFLLLVAVAWIVVAQISPATVHRFMDDICDFFIVRETTKWCHAVLAELQREDRLLIVNIGTASALVRNAELVAKNQLIIVGTDSDGENIKKARRATRYVGIVKQVVLHCKSIHDPQLHELFADAARFDAAYINGSLTEMSDPSRTLRATASMLKDGAKIYITETVQNTPSPVLQWAKPLLKRLTTVDFGKVTYWSDLQRIIDDVGMQVVGDVPVPGSIDTKAKTARIIALRPPLAQTPQQHPSVAESVASQSSTRGAEGPRLRVMGDSVGEE
eukprot:TRINITY_DN17077_c0_g1_i1.p1 TRINITY_DN17077_c0_g1~~TRINITY_DN17077_c0_g1_i1.p1  ORF type:complete len:309 (+),score=63.97 TRINITY_DN17077_c0_g1_i1:91-927(+)